MAKERTSPKLIIVFLFFNSNEVSKIIFTVTDGKLEHLVTPGFPPGLIKVLASISIYCSCGAITL